MKFFAGVVMAIGIYRLGFVAIASFMNIGTAAERISERTDAIVITVLGAVLWQLTQLLNQRGQQNKMTAFRLPLNGELGQFLKRARKATLSNRSFLNCQVCHLPRYLASRTTCEFRMFILSASWKRL